MIDGPTRKSLFSDHKEWFRERQRELDASLKAPPPPPAKLHSRGRRHRCVGCGAKGDVWTVEQVAVSAPLSTTGELSRVLRAHFRLTWRCQRCRHEDVEQRPEQLPDVPVRGLVAG